MRTPEGLASEVPDRRAAVNAKMERYTVRPHGEETREPRHVVIVPFGGDLDVGFRRARQLLSETVRLVGHGITLRGTWPGWVAKDSRGLWLTELGAYRVGEEVEPTAPLRRALASWAGAAFSGLCGRVSAADVLYGSAAARVLPNVMEMRTTAVGVVTRHREDDVEIVGARWEDLAEHLGRRRSLPARIARRFAWPPCLAATWVVALAGTAARQVDTFRASRGSRATLRELRKRPTTSPRGDVWVGLVADHLRSNMHVLESVAFPALKQGRLRGVLLVDSLRDGVRSVTDLKTQKTKESWPGLGGLQKELPDLVVDQVAGAETPIDLFVGLARVTGASAVAMSRLARMGPDIVEESGIRHDLLREVWGLARLATIDLGRALDAERAGRAAGLRHDLAGAKVVFASCTLSHLAAACLALKDAGATTVDFFHGAGIEHVPGPVESPAHVCVTWTQPDADVFVAMGRRAVEGGMPRRITPRTGSAGRRVLVASNYAHRDRGGPVMLPMQDELLRIVHLAPRGFELRWRPHPADQPRAIEDTLARIGPVPVSRSCPLADDVAWADIVVSSVSTALFEALFSGLPIFTHVDPMQDGLHVFSFAAPERSFCYAEDLWPRVLEVLDARDRGLDIGRPERRAREILFPRSSDGRPRPFDFELSA